MEWTRLSASAQRSVPAEAIFLPPAHERIVMSASGLGTPSYLIGAFGIRPVAGFARI
jgi:hypothetical protein